MQLQLKLATRQWIQSTTYECNERIFDDLLLTFEKIFLKNILLRFVALIFMLLLVSFDSKLVNNQSRIESLKIRDNSTFMPISLRKPWINDFLEVVNKDLHWQWVEQLTNLDSKGTKISIYKNYKNQNCQYSSRIHFWNI